MRPGPIIIRRCSVCTKFIEQDTIDSGNTCDARFWTDGKLDAPMMPDQPWLVKCLHCGALVWINEQEEVGEIGPLGLDKGPFTDALPYETPSADDYFSFLQKGMPEGEKERYIRLRAWWAGNDSRREGGNPTPLSNEEVANLYAFSVLLDDSDENDRILKAEIMRELNQFDDALALLSAPFYEQLNYAAAIIRNLSVQMIPFVREILFE